MAMADLSLRHLWLVLAREYRVRVRARAFIVSTVATPLMFALFLFLPAIIGAVSSGPAAPHRLLHMVIVCGDPSLADLIGEQLALNPHPSHQIDVDSDLSASHRALLNQQLDSSEIVAYAWLDRDASPVDRSTTTHGRGVRRPALYTSATSSRWLCLGSGCCNREFLPQKFAG